jgi:hypothetical protein
MEGALYRNRDEVMIVSVKTDPTFNHETPKTSFLGNSFENVNIEILNQPWRSARRQAPMMKEAGFSASCNRSSNPTLS